MCCCLLGIPHRLLANDEADGGSSTSSEDEGVAPCPYMPTAHRLSKYLIRQKKFQEMSRDPSRKTIYPRSYPLGTNMKGEEISHAETKRVRMMTHTNTEMVLRESFLRTLREYIDNCSLAGVRQMCDPDIGTFQRLIRIALFITAFTVSAYYLLYVWSDMLSKPLIVSMDTLTYPIGKVDFPAIAICNVNRISKKALQEYAREIFPIVSRKTRWFEKPDLIESVESFILEWGRLIDFSSNDSTQNHHIFKAMVELYREDNQEIIKVMHRLAPSCREMLLRCSWAGVVTSCMRILSIRRTSRGHCCTFNYVLDHNAAGLPIMSAEATKSQLYPGEFHGLTLVVDPMLDDYAYALGAIKGFQVMMYPPATYPDPQAGRVLQRFLEPNTFASFELTSIKQISTHEVRKYSTATRKCYFKEEKKKIYNNMYSYSACIVRCRVTTLHSLCKCIPFYIAKFRAFAHINVCSIEDLRCLNKYKEKLIYLYPFDAIDTNGLEMEIQESLYCPECLPDCEHTRYYVRYYETTLTTTGYPHKDFDSDFLHGINMTNKALMRIYFPLPDTTLNRLDIVNYWYEILSNIGGFGGMMLGFSIISVMEIIYYLFIRFVQIAYINFRKR